MYFAPELEEPVFVEVFPQEEQEVQVATAPAPEATRTSLISPATMVAPVVETATVAQPDPEPEDVVAEVAPAPEPEPERTIWYVTGSRVNVREGPSTDYSILGKVIYGEAAEIISDPSKPWVKIRIEGDGVEGYIMKRFMSDVDPLG